MSIFSISLGESFRLPPFAHNIADAIADSVATSVTFSRTGVDKPHRPNFLHDEQMLRDFSAMTDTEISFRIPCNCRGLW